MLFLSLDSRHEKNCCTSVGDGLFFGWALKEVFLLFFFLFSSALFEWCLISLVWQRSDDDSCLAQVGEVMAVMSRGVGTPASTRILEGGLV